MPIVRMTLPVDRTLSYDELAELLLADFPPPPFVVLGESFSGPLALRLAARTHPKAVVLCASFIRSAGHHRLAARPLSFCLRASPPTAAVRLLLAGGDAMLASDLVLAIRTVEPKVLASRVRMVLEADTTSDLGAFHGPVLYLRAMQDRIVSSRQAKLFGELRPDGEIAEIEGPHLLLQARVAECWRHIHSLVARAA